MHVLDHIRDAKDWTIKIPLYHRGHLSLLPGTTVHLAWVFRHDDHDQAVVPPEIFGTTVKRDAWATVYRITMALYDGPGVLHSALRSISRHGGNVLHLDSTSTERELHHNVEMDVDFASLIDRTHHPRNLSDQIEGLLLADCARHVAYDEQSGFRLRVRSVSSLRRMFEMLLSVRSEGQQESVITHHVEEDGRITLDKGIRSMLERAGVSPPFRYIPTSDTRDRVFRVTFIPKTQPMVWCAIRHTDKRGVLSAVTDALRKKNITILCALNRVEEHLGHNWFEVVVSSSQWRTPSVDQPAQPPKEVIDEILNSAELRSYRLSWFFEYTESRKAMREAVAASNPWSVYQLQPADDLDQWLAQKDSELLALSRERDADGRFAALADPDIRYGRALKDGINKVRRATNQVRRRIFLSIEFTARNEVKIKLVQTACRMAGVDLEIVRDSEGHNVIWQEVIERMQQSTDFVAVWTPSSKVNDGSKRPSPWCLWELGVANALGLRARVLLEKGTDVAEYRLIHGEEFYYEFGTADDFGRRIDKIIREMKMSRRKDDLRAEPH